MVLDPDFISILVCPESGAKLQVASPRLIAKLNDEVSTGRLTTRSGTTVAQPLTTALVTDDGRRVFQVHDEIPNLLMDDAIDLSLS
jgi:uncharacterized protein YbaR (Trm112 family)